MGFNIAEIFATIGADTAPFNKAVAGVKKSINDLKPRMEALSSAARKTFYGLIGVGTASVAAFADAEKQETALRSALAATGQEVDDNMKRLSDYATALSRVTTLDDDAIKGLMAYATNLGITSDKLEAVTQAGIGLGETLFGGDSKAGIEAVSKAYNGNFRALEKLIPGLKDAKTNAEKWALVQAAGARGFEQAKAGATTLTGRLKQLWNETGNVAEGFGEVLKPQLESAINFLKAVADRLKSLTPEQKKQIVQWGLYAAAIAAVIGFGPSILSFGASVVSAFMGITKAVIGLGTTIITGLFTPFGLLVAGVAAAVAAFFYFAGSGNTAVGKVIDGFKRLWDFLSFVFQNSSSLSEAMAVAWGGIGFIVSDAWANAKAAMEGIWVTIKTAFSAFWEELITTVTSAVISMTQFFVKAWDSAMSAHAAIVKATGDGMVDLWISAQEKMGMIDAKEAEARRKNAQQIRDAENNEEQKANAEKAAARQKFFDDMQKLNKEQGAQNLADIGQNETAAKAKIEAERKGKLDENARGLQRFKDQVAADFKASGKQSLSDQIEDLYSKAKKGLGIDDMLAMVDSLKREADDLKRQGVEAAEQVAGGGKDKAGKAKKDGTTGSATDVESAFKADLVRSVTAADKLAATRDEKRAKAEQEQLAAQQKGNTLLGKLWKAIKDKGVVALG